MKVPIQYALTYPSRFTSKFPRVHFPSLSEMTFFEPDNERFPCLQLAFDALTEGGTIPAVMNAANEVAVAKFLNNDITFMEIPAMISRAMEKHSNRTNPSLEEIVEADRETRRNLLS